VPRKSAEALAGEHWRAQNAPPPPPHPEPPASLSPRAAEHWRAIVRDKPSTYFDAANQVLLANLCAHLAVSDWIWREINAIDPSDPRQFRRYRTLGVMASRESRAILQMMTKLRLLPPRQPPVTPISVNGGVMPWERHR
jgi:hypothetical protein